MTPSLQRFLSLLCGEYSNQQQAFNPSACPLPDYRMLRAYGADGCPQNPFVCIIAGADSRLQVEKISLRAIQMLQPPFGEWHIGTHFADATNQQLRMVAQGIDRRCNSAEINGWWFCLTGNSNLVAC